MRYSLAAVLAFSPACAIAQARSTVAPVSAYTPQVAGIPVFDRDGVEYRQPFLGGYDVPRPQLLDIDGDGDLDLFVQERGNELIFFEQVDGQWVWRTDRFHDLEIGEWYRFVDLDGDGLWDLLGETRYSYIRAWLNTGTATAPRFELATDSLRTAEGAAIFADRQNILNLVDIDCNGRLDLFIGKVEGTIDRYEATGSARGQVPQFVLVTHRWEGIEIIGGVPGAGRPSRHGANTMAFGDIDNDGDPDLLWGDFFEPGLLLIANQGPDCASPDFHQVPLPFPEDSPLATSGYNAPTLADLDGDGRLDLVMGVIGGAFGPSTTSIDNLLLVTQDASGQFTVQTRRAIHTLDLGSESTPLLADLDGDGDLDLLVGNKVDQEGRSSTPIWFENTGTPGAPEFHERGAIGLQGEFHFSPAVADLDSDGKPDIVAGGWQDQVHWWRNQGTPGAPDWRRADSALVTITRGSNTTPAVGDLDGDGLADLVVGESSGVLNLYRNTGSPGAPTFTLVSDEFQGIDVGRRSAPHLADLDGDGRLDLLVGAEDGTIRLWRNVTTAPGEFAFEAVPGWEIRSDALATPTSGDLGDGKLVIMAGTASGGVRYFR